MYLTCMCLNVKAEDKLYLHGGIHEITKLIVTTSNSGSCRV